MTDAEHKLKGCDKCEFCRLVHCGGGFEVWGCFHKPHRGKWVIEIKDCPRKNIKE